MEFVAHFLHNFRRRADELDTGFLETPGAVRILREEPVSRVNRVGPGLEGYSQDFLPI